MRYRERESRGERRTYAADFALVDGSAGDGNGRGDDGGDDAAKLHLD